MNDLLILASLLEGPQHGYALKKRIGTLTGHGPLHNNLFYPLLRRFVATSWVSRRKAPGQRGQTRELFLRSQLVAEEKWLGNLRKVGKKVAA